MSYLLGYDVQAQTRLEAIEKATAMLRANVKLNGVVDARELRPGWWHVQLNVWEDA